VSTDNVLARRARTQVSQLTLTFLLGMGVNLIGVPDETSGAANVVTSILLSLLLTGILWLLRR